MILILLGLLLGLLVGWLLPFQIPVVASRYVSVAFLAGLDSVLGGTRAGLEKDFDFGVFAGGFLINLFLAGYSRCRNLRGSPGYLRHANFR